MSARWQWVNFDASGSFDCVEPNPIGYDFVTDLPEGWNLQRVIISASQAAGPANDIGQFNFFWQGGATRCQLGATQGGAREPPSLLRWFPVHVDWVQSYVDNSIQRQMGTMTSESFNADIELRRTGDRPGVSPIGLYCNFTYYPQGTFFTEGGYNTSRHVVRCGIRCLLSKPGFA